MVKDFRCRDEKGEAIHDIINKTNGDRTYVYNCYNMSATCYVINSTGGKCPDYAIKIRCECPSTTTAPTQASLSGNAVNGSTATRTPTSKIFGITSVNGNANMTLQTIGSVSGSGSGTSGPWSGSGNGTSVTGMGSVTIGISPGSGRGTSNTGSDGRNGTSGLETGSGTGGSETMNGTIGSGTGSGKSGSGTGSGKSGSGAGSGTGCSGPGCGTGGNQSGRYDSFAGSSSADGNFSAGGTNMPWWLIPLVVSLVLFVVNLILSCVFTTS